MIIRKFKAPFISESVIVDNEICNDISVKKGDWLYEKADIICCGIFCKDEITILFREHEDSLEHYKNYLNLYLGKHKKMYAFNKSMEYGNFKGFLGKDYNIEEIKPFKGKGWSKQKFFEILIKDKKIKEKDVPEDPLEDDSGKCLEKYKEKDYESIIIHNVADLIKQSLILTNQKYLLKKYEDYINEGGWILDGIG